MIYFSGYIKEFIFIVKNKSFIYPISMTEWLALFANIWPITLRILEVDQKKKDVKITVRSGQEGYTTIWSNSILCTGVGLFCKVHVSMQIYIQK